MKHDGYITRLQSLLRAHAVPPPAPAPAAPDLVELLVHSFLVWEATVAQADAALERIRSATVSFNDFRVCLVNEVVELIGPRYPRVQERAIRVRAAINDLFRREHAVSLERAAGMSKRDAKAYIESLQGMVPFVSARAALLGLGVHGVPVDEQTLAALVHHGVLHEETTIAEASGWLQRHIPAEKALAAHRALQRAAEKLAGSSARRGGRSGEASRRSGKSASGRSSKSGARTAAKSGHERTAASRSSTRRTSR